MPPVIVAFYIVAKLSKSNNVIHVIALGQRKFVGNKELWIQRFFSWPRIVPKMRGLGGVPRRILECYHSCFLIFFLMVHPILSHLQS
jgi:hypothetical protein